MAGRWAQYHWRSKDLDISASSPGNQLQIWNPQHPRHYEFCCAAVIAESDGLMFYCSPQKQSWTSERGWHSASRHLPAVFA